jgi:hypothetical protein
VKKTTSQNNEHIRRIGSAKTANRLLNGRVENTIRLNPRRKSWKVLIKIEDYNFIYSQELIILN